MLVFKKLKFSTRLLIISLIISIVPLLILGGISYKLARDALFKEIKEKLNIQINHHLKLIKEDFAALNPALKNYSKQEKALIQKIREKILSEKVGDTGYMYIMNSAGDLIIHPDDEGKNIFSYDFIKKMCFEKNGDIIYSWKGKKKIVSYNYYKPKDWIIASGSYLADFTKPLTQIQMVMIAVLVGGILVILAIILSFTTTISRSLNKVITNVRDGAEEILSASDQLSASSQQIATGANEQAASIEETTASMEELSSMVKQNAANSREANTLSDITRRASENGFRQMEDMLISMKEINKDSEKIRKIIKVIDDIAFQTNILALNAAVEAARAGEVGMGFAVVADEVKDLATRSAHAARETSDMIEESINKIETGLDISKKLAKTFEEILINVKKVTEMSREIEIASKEQDEGIDQTNRAIVQLDSVVQTNAGSAEEAASAAEELSSQAELLNDIVGDLVIIVNGTQQKGKNKKKKKKKKKKKFKKSHMVNKEVAVDVKYQKRDEKKDEPLHNELIPFESDEEYDVE